MPMNKSTAAIASLLPALLLALVFLHLLLVTPGTDARFRGGGFRGVSRGRGYRGGSRSSYSGGSSRSRSPTWTYSRSSVRTTSTGRRVVGYRNIRPVGGRPLTVLSASTIIYRPRPFIFFVPYYPMFYHRHYYYYYYSSGHHRVRYDRTETSAGTQQPKKTHLIFSNLEEYCGRNYGINGDETYLVSAVYSNATANSSSTSNTTDDANKKLNLTSDCSFSLNAPAKAVIRVNVSCSDKKIPKDCQISVIDQEKNDLLVYMNGTTGGDWCSRQAYSMSNKISFNISSCSDDPWAFAYSLAVDVAVVLDAGNSVKPSLFLATTTLLLALCRIFT